MTRVQRGFIAAGVAVILLLAFWLSFGVRACDSWIEVELVFLGPLSYWFVSIAMLLSGFAFGYAVRLKVVPGLIIVAALMLFALFLGLVVGYGNLQYCEPL